MMEHKDKNELDELFRRQLQHYEAQPSAQAFARVQARLQGQKRKRRGAWWLLAAALLLGGSLGAWWWQQAQPQAGAVAAKPPHSDSLAQKTSPEKRQAAAQPLPPAHHLAAENASPLAAKVGTEVGPKPAPQGRKAEAQSSAPKAQAKPAPVVNITANTVAAKADEQTAAPVALPDAEKIEKSDKVEKTEAPKAEPTKPQGLNVVIILGSEAADKSEVVEEAEQGKNSRKKSRLGRVLSRIAETDDEADEVQINMFGVNKDSLFRKKTSHKK